jgi:hypothetical protein
MYTLAQFHTRSNICPKKKWDLQQCVTSLTADDEASSQTYTPLDFTEMSNIQHSVQNKDKSGVVHVNLSINIFVFLHCFKLLAA